MTEICPYFGIKFLNRQAYSPIRNILDNTEHNVNISWTHRRVTLMYQITQFNS